MLSVFLNKSFAAYENWLKNQHLQTFMNSLQSFLWWCLKQKIVKSSIKMNLNQSKMHVTGTDDQLLEKTPNMQRKFKILASQSEYVSLPLHEKHVAGSMTGYLVFVESFGTGIFLLPRKNTVRHLSI